MKLSPAKKVQVILAPETVRNFNFPACGGGLWKNNILTDFKDNDNAHSCGKTLDKIMSSSYYSFGRVVGRVPHGQSGKQEGTNKYHHDENFKVQICLIITVGIFNAALKAVSAYCSGSTTIPKNQKSKFQLTGWKLPTTNNINMNKTHKHKNNATNTEDRTAERQHNQHRAQTT